MRLPHPRLDFRGMSESSTQNLIRKILDRRDVREEALKSMQAMRRRIPVAGGEKSLDLLGFLANPTFDFGSPTRFNPASERLGLLEATELGREFIDHPERGIEVSGGDVLFHQHSQQVQLPISVDQPLGGIREHRVLLNPGQDGIRVCVQVAGSSISENEHHPDGDQTEQSARDGAAQYRRGPNRFRAAKGHDGQEGRREDRETDPEMPRVHALVPAAGFRRPTHDPGTSPPLFRVRGTRQMSCIGSSPVLRNWCTRSGAT